MKCLYKFVLVVTGIAIIGLLYGCAPGGSLPRLKDPGSESMSFLILLVVVGLKHWKKRCNAYKIKLKEENMSNLKSSTILLTLALVFIGGTSVANAQDKPPLLNTPSGFEYRQMPPPLGQVPAPRGKAIAPPPPVRGMVPPPPPPQPIRPLTGIQQDIINNASLAVATAQKTKAYLSAGKVWSWTGRRGEVEIKAAIVYEGAVVAVLHFNPSDNSLLPVGFHPPAINVPPQIENIKRKLPAIVRSLEILNGAKYREPENAWVVPLVYKCMIVANLKVYADGIHIVPDYPANQESRAYGR
jgi:hypothetical protein